MTLHANLVWMLHMKEFNTFRIVGKYVKYLIYDLTGISVIHCIGDSHAGVFNYYRSHRVFNNTVFKVFSIGGATASGINNYNSETNARRYFDRYLKCTKKNHTLLFSLGEVDCDYVLWMKFKKDHTSIDYQLYNAVNNYIKFLDHIKHIGYENIIVYSVPYPTIKKNESHSLVSKIRKNANIGIKKRTDLTIKFNHLIKKYCKNYGITYLDIARTLLNVKTGLIDDKYINPDMLDHHLYEKEIIPLITKYLNKLGYK